MQDMFERDIYTVSRLNQEARMLVETRFSTVWIEAELSNLAQPASGHIYFTLKDKKSQVKCAMFRIQRQRVPFNIQNGMLVLARVKVSIYEARGDFQLIVEHMEPAGEGALRLAFEALKKKLDNEGLFADSLKQTVPTHPKQVGVITSATGAALRDILHVLNTRCPAIPVLIYPAVMQGEESVPSVLAALRRAQIDPVCDVLILARGGGSIEDLQAFNDETLARTIANCSLPIITGIGHEIDFTIADFVSDYRAPTPSAAAEKVSPDQQEILSKLQSLATRLGLCQQQQLSQLRQRIQWVQHRLQQQHPAQRLQQLAQRLDEHQQRLGHLAKANLANSTQRFQHAESQLRSHNPSLLLQQYSIKLNDIKRRMRDNLSHRLQGSQQQLKSLARTLHSISPLATLERGYSIIKSKTTTSEEDLIITDSSNIQPGDEINAQLAKGSIDCTVNKVYK